MNFLCRICILLSFAFMACTDSHACSCFTESAGSCHKLAIHGAMFVGQALSVKDNEPDPATAPFQKRVYRVRVVENFAGKQKVGDVVEIETGTGGGDCGYQFTLGSTYLVDAYESSGRLGTNICSATQPEAEAGLALNELRARANNKRLPDLSGTLVVLSGQASDPRDYKSLPGIDVTLLDARKVEAYHAVSDGAGIFTFLSVAPGTYRALFQVPAGYVATQAMEKKIEIAVPDVAGVGASCQIGVRVEPSGTITGRVVDHSGNGVEGFVAAYPVSQKSSIHWAAASPTDKEGNFTLVYLRDGDYRLEYSGGKLGDAVSHASVRNHGETSGVTLPLP